MSTSIKNSFLIFLLVIAFFETCKAQPRVVNVRIDLSKTYQTIDNFGASDAWSCQFAGNWPDAKRNRIADLLFSKDTSADGSPKGIALSLWRFNIGAGSAEQGEHSGIKDEWRRAESFIDNTGSYNWNQQSGQVWFLKAAKERGVEKLLGFCNSPPVQYTINHKAFADKGHTNIAQNRYGDFATFLSNLVSGLRKNEGIQLNYISPFNEPQWAWSDGGQEGCPYTNTEIAVATRAIDSAFKASNISSKVAIGEAGSIDYLYANNKAGKGNQVNDFFKASSANYIGELSHVAKAISAHSYFTTSPMQRAVTMRQTLTDSISSIPGLKFWQSEYCILGDNNGEINGSKRDLSMDAGLYLAGVIHTDLTAANASAWQWWTALSAYDYKDGLIYIDKHKTDGNFYTSKMLWILGNYSRFVRPGARRVEAIVNVTDTSGKRVLISAYRNGRQFTAVIINGNNNAITIKLNLKGEQVTFDHSYVTAATSDLKATRLKPSTEKLTIEGKSVTTITGTTR